MDSAQPAPLSPVRFRYVWWKRWLKFNLWEARRFWSSFAQNRLAVLGLVLIFVFAIMSVVHPLLMGTVWPKGVYHPEVGYDAQIFPHPSPPSSAHLLGTDTLGRDVLSMLLAATTPTFQLAMAAALTTAVIATLAGSFGAYFRGGVDWVLMQISDVFILLPAPLFMVFLSGFARDTPPVYLGIAYGVIAGLGSAAIVIRSHALTMLARPFISAAVVAGAGPGYIIFNHLIPHLLPLATVYMMLGVTGAVVGHGFVSFLGLTRVELNWGAMIYSGLTNMNVNPQVPWNVLLPPSLALSLFAASFYAVARGLHEVVNPRLRKR